MCVLLCVCVHFPACVCYATLLPSLASGRATVACRDDDWYHRCRSSDGLCHFSKEKPLLSVLNWGQQNTHTHTKEAISIISLHCSEWTRAGVELINLPSPPPPLRKNKNCTDVKRYDNSVRGFKFNSPFTRKRGEKIVPIMKRRAMNH